MWVQTRKRRAAVTKRDNLFRHSKDKAAERYGLNLRDDDIRCVVNKIKRGDGTHIMKCSDRVSAWDVELYGKVCRVLYDKQRKCLVTFLPPGAPVHPGNYAHE